MPDERVIQEIENILSDVVALGGERERTSIVPNMLIRNASPADSDYIIIADNRDDDNILALRVPGVVYADNDLVNVIFPQGGEAIAFQQGSGSSTSGLWDIVTGTDDIYYNKGDVGIGKSVAPDAALEVLSTTQAQLRLTFQEDTKYADFTVDTNHDLTIDPSSTGEIKLASVDVTIEEDLIHEGDPDTKLTFTTDDIEFTAGNLSMLKLTEAGQDLITLGAGAGDIDIDFNGDMFLQGSDGFFSINHNTPRNTLDIDSAADFDLAPAEAGQDNIFLRNTSGGGAEGDYSGSIGFGKSGQAASAAARRAAIVGLQTDTDDDELGIAFYVHPGSSSQDIELGMVIDHTKRLLVGNIDSTQIGAPTGVPLYVYGLDGQSSGVNATSYRDDEFGGSWLTRKSRGTQAVPVIVDDDDWLGRFTFAGWDGVNWINAARFGVQVDGAPGVDDMPGRLVFQTTPDGSDTPAERLRIDNAGDVGIAVTAPAAQLDVDQSSATGAQPVLRLDQADVSEEMRQFETTIGVGNAIEAVGAKVLTVTHFVKDTLPGALTRYTPYGTIGAGASPPIIYTITRIDDGDSPYAVLATDEIIVADTDGGAITVNLPAGVDGTHYRITNVGTAANDVTVDPNGAEELFGGGAGVSFALVDGETINIYYETTEGWW